MAEGTKHTWTRIDDGVIDRIAEIGPTAFAIYAALAKHTDTEGTCYPSVSTLGTITGLSRRTVQLALRRLQKEGLVMVVVSKNDVGRSLANLYKLTHLPPDREGARDCAGGRTRLRGRAQETAREGAPGCAGEGAPSCAPTRTIENKNHRTRTSELEGAALGARKPAYTVEFEKWWSVYPRKVGKKVALKQWQLAVKRIDAATRVEAVEYLTQRTEAFAKSLAGQAGQFTPHPSTWLSQGRYDDDEAEWNRARDGGQPVLPDLFDGVTLKDD